MLSKANFFFLKKGREPNAQPAPFADQFSVTAAVAATAISAAAALSAAATTAAMLVGVPCDPAHTAKHDDSHNDGRQIKVCGEKFHHTKHTLSHVMQFDQILVTSILTSLSPAYLLGRTIR
jgi:cephalosporin hydroxylase